MPGIPGNTCIVNGAATFKCLEPLFARILTVATGLAGIVFFIMLLIGGFRYLFSGGNPKTVEAAKGTLTAAFLGLILVVSAYLILLVLETFTGLPLTIFKVGP